MALPPRSGALPPVVRRDAGRSPASALGTGWAFGIGPEVHPAGPTRGAYALPEVRPAGWALTRWPDLLPPPPRGDVLTPPLVVAPPTLAELDATTPDAALAVMLRTYLSCVERTQGLSPAGRRTGGIASAKRPALLAACEALRVVDVAPAAWVQTRVVAWRRAAEGRAYAARKRGDGAPSAAAPLPPFAWVLAAAAVTRYVRAPAHSLPTGGAGDDAADAGRLAVPVASGALPPAFTALLGAWQAARVALLTLPDGGTYEDAHAAVLGHLGAWESRCATVQREHAALADAARYLARQGEWVWVPPAVAPGGVSLAALSGVLAATGRERLNRAIRGATAPVRGLPAVPGVLPRPTATAALVGAPTPADVPTSGARLPALPPVLPTPSAGRGGVALPAVGRPRP